MQHLACFGGVRVVCGQGQVTVIAFADVTANGLSHRADMREMEVGKDWLGKP